jgi:hypothetical protein
LASTSFTLASVAREEVIEEFDSTDTGREEGDDAEEDEEVDDGFSRLDEFV